MADRTGMDRIVAECEGYWRATGVPEEAIYGMRAELETHLTEAQQAGKTPEAVVGADVAAFAEEWAAEYRGTGAPSGTPLTPVTVAPAWRRSGTWIWSLMAATVGITIVLAAAGPKENTMDIELWRWIWVGAVVVLGIGEMLTAGFFLLPFAVGAAAAAFLAFFDISVTLQLVLFAITSVLFLVLLQRYARMEEELQHAVGANRYLGARATVLESVNRLEGAGRVRMDTEEWRATTDRDGTIPAGVEVRVVDVRGARLVVEPID